MRLEVGLLMVMLMAKVELAIDHGLCLILVDEHGKRGRILWCLVRRFMTWFWYCGFMVDDSEV